MSPKTPPARTRYILIGSLVALAVLYIALIPWLRRMMAETERYNRLALEREAEAARLKQMRSALEEARAAADRNPKDGRAQIRLSQEYGNVGRITDALRHAEIAVGLLPSDPAARVNLAVMLQRARRYPEATQAYRAALLLNPLHPPALTGLGSLYVSFGWPADAITLLEPAVKALPQNPHLKIPLAMAYMQKHENAAAEHLLLDVRRTAPLDVALWSPLVTFYNDNKRYQEAITTAQEVLLRQPDNAAIQMEMGRAYLRLNDVPKAKAAFQQALRLQPDSVNAHYSLGLCYQKLNQPQEAIKRLEYVLRHAPAFEQTRLLLGQLYMQTGREAEGRSLLTEARRQEEKAQRIARTSLLVATRPRDASAHRALAQVYQEIGDTPRAILELVKTLELNPNDTDARAMLRRLHPSAATLDKQNAEIQVMAGLASLRAGRIDEARRYAEQALKIAPALPSAYLLLARVFSNRGTGRQVLDAIQTYLKLTDHPAPGYYLMGRYYYRNARWKEAEAYLKRALETDPNNPDYLIILGRVYCELAAATHLEEGIRCFERALAQRPDDGETHAALGRALMQRQQWDSAIQHLREAVQHSSNAGPILYTLSQALARAGQREESEKALAEYRAYQEYKQGMEKRKRAIQAAPKDRTRHYDLVRFSLAYSQYAAAEAALDNVERTLGPDDISRKLRKEIAVRASAR